MFRRVAQLAAVATLLAACCPGASAQIPKRLKPCLPYPTLDEEIAQMNLEVQSKIEDAENGEEEAAKPRIVLDDVLFDAPIHLSPAGQQKLRDDLMHLPLYDLNRKRLDEIEEVGVRGAWQDEGFFKVEASLQPRLLRADANAQHVAFVIHVDEGLQYHLGTLEFKSGDVGERLHFSQEELRPLIPLASGDLFRADEIRKSLENLRKLYGLNGYIDFVASPEWDIDEARGVINLTMVLMEERQFRIGQVKVFTADPTVRAAVLQALPTGEVFTSERIPEMLKKYATVLPADASESDIKFHRNVKAATVDIILDFLTCPPANE